jgi:hypothetical protein
MATPPGEDVANNDQVRSRGASRAFANCHRRKRIGGVGVKALALPAGLVNGSSGALGGKLEAVDEGHSRSWRKRAFEANHPEPVAPMAEMPSVHLLAMKVAYVSIGLAVLSGFVAQLAQVRAPCHLQQFGFSTWRLGLCLHDLGCLQEGQMTRQESLLGVGAILQASDRLEGLAGLAGGATHLTGHPCSPIVKAAGLMSTASDSTCCGQ